MGDKGNVRIGAIPSRLPKPSAPKVTAFAFVVTPSTSVNEIIDSERKRLFSVNSSYRLVVISKSLPDNDQPRFPHTSVSLHVLPSKSTSRSCVISCCTVKCERPYASFALIAPSNSGDCLSIGCVI